MERREKEVREERSQGRLFSGSVLQGIEETGSKERNGPNKAQRRCISPLSLLNEKEPVLLFTDRCPPSSSGNLLSLTLLVEAKKNKNR